MVGVRGGAAWHAPKRADRQDASPLEPRTKRGERSPRAQAQCRGAWPANGSNVVSWCVLRGMLHRDQRHARETRCAVRRRRTTSSAEKRAHDASEAQRWLLLGACSYTSRDQEVGSLPLGRRLPRRGTPARARHRSSPHPHLCTHSAGAGSTGAGRPPPHARARPPARQQPAARPPRRVEGGSPHARTRGRVHR